MSFHNEGVLNPDEIAAAFVGNYLRDDLTKMTYFIMRSDASRLDAIEEHARAAGITASVADAICRRRKELGEQFVSEKAWDEGFADRHGLPEDSTVLSDRDARNPYRSERKGWGSTDWETEYRMRTPGGGEYITRSPHFDNASTIVEQRKVTAWEQVTP